MSEQEKTMLEKLEKLAEKMSAEAKTAWLAYGNGLADGARSVQSGEKAG